MYQHFLRSAVKRILIGAVAVGISAAGIVTAGAAHAVPSQCNTPEAPPACTPGPPPIPSQPKSLESAPFAPIAEQQNRVTVQIEGVTDAAVSGYSTGDETRFRVSVACSNGFFRSAPLAFIRIVGQNFLRLNVDLPGGSLGSCRATTWDQSALGLNQVSIVRDSPNGTLVTRWRIFFNP